MIEFEITTKHNVAEFRIKQEGDIYYSPDEDNSMVTIREHGGDFPYFDISVVDLIEIVEKYKELKDDTTRSQ